MTDYDFSTLNSSDLEYLVCDLLNEQNIALKNGVVFHTYKDGKDKGIDFRFSIKGNDNYVVGQVKHYLVSGVNVLLRDLKGSEKAKVIALSPKRYIFATSLDLSVQNIEDIFNLFAPYINTLNDIYGRKPLNALLLSYPQVLDRHFKLWYSNTEVLQKLLHFEHIGRSLEFTEEYLKKKLNLFVRTPAFDKTREHLANNKFVIITGDPGIGKTTLAELLVYEYIKDDFKLTYVYDDIRDIDKEIKNDDSKQLFYFDDFLGHNSVEIQKAKGSESVLIMILNRVKRAKNKYLIFTTRSFIFGKTVEQSQKFVDFNIKHFESYIDLKDYQTDEVRRQILLNHAEYSDIHPDLKGALKEYGLQRFITKHQNFSPRSVEYITTAHRVNHLAADAYKLFIQKNFTYPDDIWKEAYLDQIDDMQRLMLNTMFSLGDSVAKNKLEKAFEARLAYEVKHNNFTKPMFVYRNTFKTLYGSFIVDDNVKQRGNFYRFNNPSLVDFLDKFIASNEDEVHRITISALYLTQLITRFYVLYGSERKFSLPADLKVRLINFDFEIANFEDYDHLVLAFILLIYVKSDEAVDLACKYFLEIEDYEEAIEDTYIVLQFIQLFKVTKNPKVINTINHLGMKIFGPMIDDEIELDEVVKLCRLISERFDIDPKLLLYRDAKSYKSQIEERFFSDLEQELEDLKTYITSEDELDDVGEKYSTLAKDLEEFGISVMNFNSYFNYMDWSEVIMDNQFHRAVDDEKDKDFDD